MTWQQTRFVFVVALLALGSPVVTADNISDITWNNWFATQVEQHPDVIAARERMNSAFSTAENLEQPLYNPELETEYEREVDADNYRVGLSQTIDWWDKRSVRQQQAVFDRAVARNEFQVIRQRKAAAALNAITDWQSASELAALARDQERQLDSLLSLVQSRLDTGDLGQLDTELTYLGLSQRLFDTAQAQAQLSQAQARVLELLPAWAPQWAQIPDQLLSLKVTPENDTWLDRHPVVLSARWEWEALQQAVELARLDTRAEPTVGINAGRSTEGDVAALTLSIPLNIRNDYSALARAASQRALAAEAHYRAIRQQQQAAITSAEATLQAYQKQFERWQSLMQGRSEHSGELLERQWSSGDLSVTEYVLALQQRSEGLGAGIALRTEYQLARIDWLLQTAQMGAQLAALSHQQPGEE